MAWRRTRRTSWTARSWSQWLRQHRKRGCRDRICRLFPLKPGGELSLPDYFWITPSVRNGSTCFPGTEELDKDEMRITCTLTHRRGWIFAVWHITRSLQPLFYQP
jgi:hypothetical protein